MYVKVCEVHHRRPYPFLQSPPRRVFGPSPWRCPFFPRLFRRSSLASPPRGAPPSAPTRSPSPPSASPSPRTVPGRAEAKEGATPSAPALPSLPGQKPKPQSAPVSPGMPQSSLLRSAVRTDSEHASAFLRNLLASPAPAAAGGGTVASRLRQALERGLPPAAESLAAFLSDGAFDAAQRQTAREEEGGPGRTPPRSAPPTAFSTTPPALPAAPAATLRASAYRFGRPGAPIPLASEGPAFGAAVDVDAAIREDAADEEEWEDTALDAAAVQVRAPPQATRSRSRLSAAASAEKLEPFMLFDANRS
eukprot:tig00021289_g19955.t1